MSHRQPPYAPPSGHSAPRRTPTDSSYYDFVNTSADQNTGQTWMYARDARAQQATASQTPVRPYPNYYGNKSKTAPPLNLSTQPEAMYNPKTGKSTQGWLHTPLVPSRQTTWKGHKNSKASPIGPVRSVYPPSNPNTFDVIYHEKKGDSDFVLAKYYPAATR
ncbi:hypothetical protein S40293_11544 [Stachybotrys chartarum IBT 40293]|nr:hypothetical protein S40293_11544 [Stachybotrys chartarum IBT 40293]